jgi:hypothetical protein
MIITLGPLISLIAGILILIGIVGLFGPIQLMRVTALF